MPIAENSTRESPSKRKEKLDGKDRKPKPHEMRLQVPRRVHTQESKKDVVRTITGAFGRGVSRACAEQREPVRRGLFDGGSFSHADFEPTEV